MVIGRNKIKGLFLESRVPGPMVHMGLFKKTHHGADPSYPLVIPKNLQGPTSVERAACRDPGVRGRPHARKLPGIT